MWRIVLEYDSDSITMDVNTNEAPRGFNELRYIVERDDFNNLSRSFSEPLGFTKAVRTWIKSKIAADGQDITIDCYIKLRDYTYTYNTVIEGILNIEGYREDRLYIDFNVSDNTFNTKLTQRATNEIEYNSKYTIDQSEVPGFTNNFIELELEGIGGTTTVKGVYLYEAFTKLAQKITDTTYNVVKSSILGRTDLTSNGFSSDYAVDGFLGRIVVTKGLIISGIEPNGITTKVEGKTDLIMQFKDLFEAVNTIYPIGMDVVEISGTKYIIIESLDYFFKNAQYSFTLGKDQVKDVEKRLISKFFNNKVKFGFNVVSNDNEYALGDFTGDVEYTTPLQNYKGEYTHISRYSISPSDIEFARQNPVSGRAEDSQKLETDDINFLIDCYLDGTTLKSRDKTEGFQGDVSGAYGSNKLYTNARIRPTQSVINHGRYIKVSLQYNESDYLLFQSSKNLSKIQSQLAASGIVVTDLTNIDITDLDSENGEVFLSGYENAVSTYLTAAQLAEIQANKDYILKFWDITNDEFQYGWVRKLETNAKDGKETLLTLWQPNSITTLPGGYILQENGYYLLLESGGKLLQ